ncbi:AAA family ATPase [Streptomyces sp. NPDC004610]|uniref:helix-turn-helix transcriptional regulator n=1 Tax=unclassified Streptomyces TaxID=2593676 RepID=UPI0033B4A41C
MDHMVHDGFTGGPLVGRGDEIARLSGALRRARGGEGRAVLVAGDAGVGKTRLLEEIAGRAARDGMTVLTGHCVDLGDVGLPYLPFTEILGALAADERFAPVLAAHPAAERLLGAGAADEPNAAERSGGGRLRLFEGMAALLAEVAERAPLLLVLEDLHWADQSSRDLLRFLLSRGVLQRAAGGAPTHRLALLASYRADDLHRRHPLRPLLAELVRLPSVERLELRPMPDTEVAALVRGLRETPLPEATVRRIVERAEGNAFYAEELLAATGTGDGGVPTGLADVLLIRFEQLSDTAQQVLRTAAVAGRRVAHATLREAVGLPDDALEDALREAVGRQLLLPGDDGTYRFRHALAREAVYADLLPGERSRLHGAFARLLAARGPAAETAAERAHHYYESHDLAEALTASLEAADHARRVGAPAEELRHLETALELWSVVPPAALPGGVERIALTLRAAGAAAHAGQGHRAVALNRSALADVGADTDSELAARVRYALAGTLLRIDSQTAAFAYSSEALELIPADPPSPTWVWAAATHVLAAWMTGDSRTALEVGRLALPVAERLGIRDAQADLLISLVAFESGGRRTPEGRERLQEARELARTAGNAPVEMRALFNLAVGCFEGGDLEECLSWVAEGLDRARRAGLLSSPYPLELRYLRLLALYTLGRWDTCVEAAREDTEVLPAAGGFTAGPALYVRLARGESAAVEAAAEVLMSGPFDWMAHLVAAIVLVDAAALRGDAEGAVDRLRTMVRKLTDEAGTPPDVAVRLVALALSPVADRATALRLSGDTAGAARWARTAEELVELARTTARYGQNGSPQGPEGMAWLARAEAERTRTVTGPDPAVWERAVAAFGFADRYERARCRLRLAEALLAAGRREEAASEARAVRETAEELGASVLRERVDALIRRGRLMDGVPGGPAAPSPLTARERDVLRLLTLGRSNRQIGEELFITGKTASVHVSNILAKLGAASRTEAVAIAYQRELIGPDRTASG